MTVYSQSLNGKKRLGEEIVVLRHCKTPTKRLTDLLMIFKKFL